MDVLIIGGVAAGTKAAAKLKRIDPGANVTIITNSPDISYAGCGLPYYAGGVIEDREELIVNTPEDYSESTGAKVITGVEATGVNPSAKTVTAKNLATGETTEYTYDKLVVATGASSAVPNIPGTDLPGVFKMRVPSDAIDLRDYIDKNDAKSALVVGGGFIGLEVAENLKGYGLSVTVVDFAPQIMPNVIDPEMADFVRRHLAGKGIKIFTGTGVNAIKGNGRAESVETTAGVFYADIVVLSAGIRPNTAFLEGSGIETERGYVVIDGKMQTNVPDIYAAGDCVIVKNRITGARQVSAMGSSANIEGRALAQIIYGADKNYPGVLGTGVVKLPGLNCGRTGLTEAAAKDAGYDVVTILAVNDDKAHYYPDAAFFITKLIADRNTHKLLGMQVLGPGAVDKMTDIAVVGISMGAKLEDFEFMDMAYAPPFSTAIHPFVAAADILMNKINGEYSTMTPAEYAVGAAEGYTIVDTTPDGLIPNTPKMELETIFGAVPGFDKDEKLLLVCNRGKRAYFTARRLQYYGYKNVKVLEGGKTFNVIKTFPSGSDIPPEEIKRVKGLGFLGDKTAPGKFNCRVITRNGKITAEESAAISQAAKLYGNGEIAMTSRLTIEIQAVPYENIEPIMEYLASFGLETGGTGSKVRPVVSCKGTTCQYGLIDTFALSDEIHELFYKGYHEVNLPHKFKIAVGGCPNNCVKPDLNDLGIIGQRVPIVDLDKCKGCKACKVEEACPIKTAHVTDGKIQLGEDCNHCGRCIGTCPFGAVENYTNGYRIYIGGRWGKKTAQGRYLDRVFTDKQEVIDIVEKAILLFREQGKTGERFADTIARLGFENVQKQLLSNELLERKSENLDKDVTGGASC